MSIDWKVSMISCLCLFAGILHSVFIDDSDTENINEIEYSSIFGVRRYSLGHFQFRSESTNAQVRIGIVITACPVGDDIYLFKDMIGMKKRQL